MLLASDTYNLVDKSRLPFIRRFHSVTFCHFGNTVILARKRFVEINSLLV